MSEQNVTDTVVEVVEKAGLSTPKKVAIFAAAALVGAGLVLVIKARANKKAEEISEETEPTPTA